MALSLPDVHVCIRQSQDEYGHCRASDIRAQELCAPGVRTRIRSGALPPTAGRIALAAEPAAELAVVQASASKAGSVRRLTPLYSVCASAVASQMAEEDPSPARRQSASAKTANSAVISTVLVSGESKAAPAQESRTSGQEQRKPGTSALLGAKAKMSRFGRLIRGSGAAAAASKVLQEQPSSLGREAEGASLAACAPDEAPAVEPSAARSAGRAPVEDTADAAAPVSQSAVRAEKDTVECGGRGRKRPSPKKAPGPLGFRARRAPRSELFSKDGLAAAKTGKPIPPAPGCSGGGFKWCAVTCLAPVRLRPYAPMGMRTTKTDEGKGVLCAEGAAAMDQPRGLGQRRAVEGT